MSKPVERVEIITGIHRRRRYTAEEKVRLVEQTMQPGMTVSAFAWLHGVALSLLFQWRRHGPELPVDVILGARCGLIEVSRARRLRANRSLNLIRAH